MKLKSVEYFSSEKDSKNKTMIFQDGLNVISQDEHRQFSFWENVGGLFLNDYSGRLYRYADEETFGINAIFEKENKIFEVGKKYVCTPKRERYFCYNDGDEKLETVAFEEYDKKICDSGLKSFLLNDLAMQDLYFTHALRDIAKGYKRLMQNNMFELIDFFAKMKDIKNVCGELENQIKDFKTKGCTLCYDEDFRPYFKREDGSARSYMSYGSGTRNMLVLMGQTNMAVYLARHYKNATTLPPIIINGHLLTAIDRNDEKVFMQYLKSLNTQIIVIFNNNT